MSLEGLGRWLNLASYPSLPGQPGFQAGLYLEPQLWPREVAVSLCCAVSPPGPVMVITWEGVEGIEQYLVVGHTRRLQGT